MNLSTRTEFFHISQPNVSRIEKQFREFGTVKDIAKPDRSLLIDEKKLHICMYQYGDLFEHSIK